MLKSTSLRWFVPSVLLCLAGCAPPTDSSVKNEPLRAPGEVTLYQQLGGAPEISAIVDSMIEVAIADPRINFIREGHTHQWTNDPDHLAQLKTYWTQYIEMLADGPQLYEGRNILQVHQGMDISEGEWLAFMDDFKKTLDRYHIPTDQERDLLTRVAGTHDAVVNK